LPGTEEKKDMSLSSKTAISFIFIIGCLTIISAQSVNAQLEEQVSTQTVVVIGTGKIYKADSAGARTTAIEESLVLAVERVALDLVPAEVLNQTFQTFNKTLYDKIAEFIEGYRVLAEFQDKDAYRVVVEANVSVAGLKKLMADAGIMSGGKSLPKILVLISEQRTEDQLPQYWWGQQTVLGNIFSVNALVETLKNRGFQVADHLSISQNKTIDARYDKPDLSNYEAASLGLELNADVAIVGMAALDKTQTTIGKNIRSFKGIVSARAVRTDTGEEIAAITQSGVTADADEASGTRNALSAAGSQAGETLASQIIAVWQNKKEASKIIEIVVEGTSNLTNFEKFIRILNKISGVRNLQIKELKADEALVTVKFQGNAKALADDLMLNSHESISINIYEVSPHHLRVALISG